MSIKDKLRKVNPKIPPIVVVAVSVLLAALFVFKVYMPMAAEKATLEDELAQVQQKVEEDRLKVRKMQELVAANEKLDRDLKKAQEILPSDEEMSTLLDTISGFVKDSGLKIKDWKREKTVTDKSKLYSETAIKVEVNGSYHQLGKFMERLDGLTRLVTVSSLQMESAKLAGYEMNIPTKFSIVAYSAAGGK